MNAQQIHTADRFAPADVVVRPWERKHGYPPVDRDEIYKEIFEQAENFKKYQTAKRG
jgi:hypothetical protein